MTREEIWPNHHIGDCPVCGDKYVFRIAANPSQTQHIQEGFIIGKVCTESDRAAYLHPVDYDNE